MQVNNKQIFHDFLFNIRNYSQEVINIQRRKAKLNIILPEDNTEKIWVHRFLAKPKTIAGGGLGGAVSPPGDPG